MPPSASIWLAATMQRVARNYLCQKVDESHKYLLGYFFIIVISIFLLVNSIILILSLSKSTYQILRLIFTRLNNWLAKKFPNRFKVIKKAKTKEEIDEDKK